MKNKRISLMFRFITCFITVGVLSCNDVEISDTLPLSVVENKVLLEDLNISEAELWYKNVLLNTPKINNSQRQNATNGRTNHPLEKKSNFRFAFTAKIPNENGNIVVVPLHYEGLKDLIYINNGGKEGNKNLDLSKEAKSRKFSYQNNLILYKQKDGSITSYIMRVLPYEKSLKKHNNLVSGKDFSGEIQYFDWNENFITGQVYDNGAIVARITSVSNDSNNKNNKNGRVQSCQWVYTSVS